MVAEFAADHETLQRLRAQLAEYEQIFRNAAPRLAAFKKLEEVAREQRKTPAAVAAEAALVVLAEQTRDKQAELRRLADECGDLKGELAMLLQNKNRMTTDVDVLDTCHGDLRIEVAEILNELQLLRNDAVRLMAERRALEDELESLRSELGAIRSRRRDEGPEPVDPVMIAVDTPAAVATRTVSGFEIDDEDESRRFDQFFHANVEHDKARDWILG